MHQAKGIKLILKHADNRTAHGGMPVSPDQPAINSGLAPCAWPSAPRFVTSPVCRWLALLAVVLVSVWRLDRAVRSERVHIDEAGWILTAVCYGELVRSGDFSSPAWEQPELDAFGSLNPLLGKLWLATGIYLNPSTRDTRFSPSQLATFRTPAGSADSPISPELLRVARYTHAVSGLVCVILVFLVAGSLGGWPAGMLASLALLGVDAFVATMGRVFTDGVFLIWVLVLTACLIRFARCPAGRGNRWLLAASASVGLAFNIKMTALVLGLATLGLVVFACAWLKRRPIRTLFKPLLAGIATALAACYLPNPYLWPTAAAPADGGSLSVLLPMRFVPMEKDPHWSPLLGHAPVLLRLPEMHLRWNRQIQYQRTAWPEQAASKGRNLLRLFHTYNHQGVGAGAFVALVAVTAARWARSKPFASPARLAAWCRGHPSLAIFILITIIHVGWLVIMVPLDWDRYYLPGVLHLQILAAVGVTRLVCTMRPTKLDQTGFPGLKSNRPL